MIYYSHYDEDVSSHGVSRHVNFHNNKKNRFLYLRELLIMMYVIIRFSILLILMVPELSHARCDVVATVFNQAICRSDIALHDKKPGANAPSDPGRRLRLENIRLGHKIRAIAAEHLLPKSSYTPTQEEVDTFEKFSARSAARKTRDDEEIIATAKQLLTTYEYDERIRQSLENTITTFKRSIELSKDLAEGNKIRDEDMQERLGGESVVRLHQRLKQSKRKSSERWVADWKMNKALFEKYGGRVIFQQAGIEPIDAYRDYLKDIKEKGGLKILKPEYADVFDDFERYLDMGHNYLSEPGDTFFSRPYWETVDLDAEQRKRIDELKATPHKER